MRKNNNHVSDFIYIHLNENDQYVISYGIGFGEFYRSLYNQMNNILLLKHAFRDADFNMHTLLGYVPRDRMTKLVEDDISNYGDFCWIDFEEEECLDAISDKELAELLYLGHRKELWKAPFYQILQNRYVYLANGDGWWNKVYYRNLLDFYRMLGETVAGKLSNTRLSKSFIGMKKRRLFPPVDVDVILQMKLKMKEGLLIAVSDASKTRNVVEVPLWIVGDFDHVDDMLGEYKRIAKGTPDGKLLFDRKTKEWKL